jgi:predicted RNA-binding Zn ribbon-like protein
MDIDRLRLRSGRVCLDMTATVIGRHRDESGDQLTEPADLTRWLRATGLPSPKIPVRPAVVAQARELREAIYRLVHPDLREKVDPEDVAIVNLWAAVPDAAPQLTSGARSSYQQATRLPAQAALSSIARDAVNLLSGDLLDRVRECARPDCSVLFFDASRPGRRRWCDMAVCGNQTKAKRHRQQRATVT